jgi:ATP-dependent Clp protease protease subunit
MLQHNIENFFDYDVLLDTRTILICDSSDDGVDNSMANRFVKAMAILEHESSDPIRVLLKSQGGCIFNGAAMYDSIAMSPCYITTEVYGCAMSMGSILLQAADKRVMMPSSLLMMHDGTFSMDAETRSFENWAVLAKKLRRQMYEIFAERTGKTIRYWEKMCQSDYILDAKEALKLGLIDQIANPNHS